MFLTVDQFPKMARNRSKNDFLPVDGATDVGPVVV